MGSIQSSTMILCALGNRSASFLSRRAHLLTTSSEQTPYHSLCLLGRAHSFRCSSSPQKVLRLSGAPFGGVFPLEIVRSPRGMRLLRKPDGQCHSSADLLSLSTQLVCGKRLQNTVASADGIPPTARTNLPPSALSAVMTISIADSHFLFYKEKQKLYERTGKTKWRSIIWKRKSSAGAQDDPAAPLLPI